MEKRKFRLADVVLSVICVVFVAEAAAPVASIGNSQYFWWLFMIAAFLLPYGLISSELGTAFPGDGGLYDWIHTAWPLSNSSILLIFASRFRESRTSFHGVSYVDKVYLNWSNSTIDSALS